MNSIVIHISKKWDLWPRYGQADRDRGAVYVREDLPLPVRVFVEAHELGHIRGWGELRSSILPMILLPVGLIMAVGMTLFHRDRLEFYKKKVKEWLK